MLLSFKCIHSYVRQLQIQAVCRILFRKHFSPQEAPSLPFLYKDPKKRFRKLVLSLIIARHTKNLFFFLLTVSLFNLHVMFTSWSASYLYFLSSLPACCRKLSIDSLEYFRYLVRRSNNIFQAIFYHLSLTQQTIVMLIKQFHNPS